MFTVSDGEFPKANRHDQSHVHPAIQGQQLQEEAASPGMLHGRRPSGIGGMSLHESKVMPGRTTDETRPSHAVEVKAGPDRAPHGTMGLARVPVY